MKKKSALILRLQIETNLRTRMSNLHVTRVMRRWRVTPWTFVSEWRSLAHECRPWRHPWHPWLRLCNKIEKWVKIKCEKLKIEFHFYENNRFQSYSLLEIQIQKNKNCPLKADEKGHWNWATSIKLSRGSQIVQFFCKAV